MKVENISASLLNFLAGVTASVAVTFLTSIATSDLEDWSLVLAALPWIVAAFMLTLLGGAVEEARRLADLYDKGSLSHGERIEVYRDVLAEASVRNRVRSKAVGAILATLAGLAVLPLAFGSDDNHSASRQGDATVTVTTTVTAN